MIAISANMQEVSSRHWMLSSMLILAVMLVLETVLVVMLGGGLPNYMDFPIQHFWPMFTSLFADYPWQSLELAVHQVAVEIAHKDAISGTALWSIHYFPLKVIVYPAVAIFAGVLLSRSADSDVVIRHGMLAIGVVMMMLTVSFIMFASCCSGPTWVVDLLLRVLADPSRAGSGFWFSLYPRNPLAFTILRLIMALTGIILLARSCRKL